MTMSIYTYSNPYKLKSEIYWSLLKNNVQFCASQTLANGMCDIYEEFFPGQLTTIQSFINNLYHNWESDVTRITQLAVVDNLIDSVDLTAELPAGMDIERLKHALKRNRQSILQAIRIMFEMDMDPDEIRYSKLTKEQKYLLLMYKELRTSNYSSFRVQRSFTQQEIEKALKETIKEAAEKSGSAKRHDISEVNTDVVVVHGIHQFSPIILRALEQLSEYKDVIILFNYVKDYRNVYETWLSVYECFEQTINISKREYSEHSDLMPGSRLASELAALVNGDTTALHFDNSDIEVIQFDNTTEFAGYISGLFEDAEQTRKEDNNQHNSLYYLKEQFYAADSSVNDILKIYFPEQFKERQFLDYPAGHFFISITNLWDPDTKTLRISDLNDVLECLSCGIIKESSCGSLASIFSKTQLYFEGCSNLQEVQSRLRRLKREIINLSDSPDDERVKRFAYFNVSENEIEELKSGLDDLQDITDMFFADFNSSANDFTEFYKKIKDVLERRIVSAEGLDEDFKRVAIRILERIKETEHITAKASFECLRETMQMYLQQSPVEGRGANWIVKNFEQIDGDILRPNKFGKDRIYHFACLSDTDMGITRKELFPWPLDVSFFEVAQSPVDWKYRVYVSSKREYKNFRRYALIYGLEFCNSKIELSYIKNEKDQVSEPYYLLRILGIKPTPYVYRIKDKSLKNVPTVDITPSPNRTPYTKYDLIKFRLCPYRFMLESLITENSVYADRFLVKKYMEIILENSLFEDLANQNYDDGMAVRKLRDKMSSMDRVIRFALNSELMDITNNAADYIKKNVRGRFSALNENQRTYMIKRELFLAASMQNENRSKEVFKDSTQYEVDQTLSDDNLKKEYYLRNVSELCESCSIKDICLENYRHKRNKRGNKQ